jgi:uncharacterized repeat protein (TIGR01451 family)
LTVSKTSAVYSDPFNGTDSPKAIPGAVVTYTITVTNPAGSTATVSSVSIADTLDGNLEFKTQFNDGTDCGADKGIVVAGTCNTNAADADNANYDAGSVNVTGLSLAPNETKVIKFQVTVL